MSGDLVAGIISLGMVLILALGALRSRKLSWKTGTGLAIGWIGIFAIITLIVRMLL